MRRFVLFMVIFGLAFAGIQKVEAEEVAVTAIKASDVKTLNIPCVKAQGISYKVTLKGYLPSDAEKKELNLNSQEVSFWELANADVLPQPPAACGIWDEKTFNFNSCEGDFRFRRDMEGKDVFGFYWVKEPNPTISIGNPIVLQSTVDTKQEVKICFINKDIKEASYETSEGGKGDFELVEKESTDTCLGMKTGFYLAPKTGSNLNFSSPGVKTVKISGKDSCGVSATDASVNITVKDPCDEVSPPTISNLTATAVKQAVTVLFGANPNIKEVSYTTSDGTKVEKSGSDKNGNFNATLNFSTSGKKTITVDVVNSCEKKASKSVDVMVCGSDSKLSIVGNKVYFGEGSKVSSSGFDPGLSTTPTDLLLFDLNRTLIVRENSTKHLVSFDYTVDPANPVTEIRITDHFREILPPFYGPVVSDTNIRNFSMPITLSDGLYDLSIKLTNQCETYEKVFPVQFQRP